jgi:putative oxidoreductase
MLEAILLPGLQRYGDMGLLLMRCMVGAFLVWGVWDNIHSVVRMREFVEFLSAYGFASPQIMAPVSVWAQCAVGIAFLVGLATRWAGMVCAVNFIVAIVMVDAGNGIRGAFPSACLVAIGIFLALHGAGRFSIDAKLERSAGSARLPGT